MPRPARRPLDPTELSWIIEQKIYGKIPIRMFPSPETSVTQNPPAHIGDDSLLDVESDNVKEKISKK